jgi:hypothetical protein
MSTATQHHVFLSYHPHDEPLAKEIARRLRDEHGIRVWLRAWSVVPGTLTQEAQEAGLAQSDACAVLIGREGVRVWKRLADWVDEGTEDLLMHRRVEDAARQWARERDDSLLHRGLQLEKALEWQKRRI